MYSAWHGLQEDNIYKKVRINEFKTKFAFQKLLNPNPAPESSVTFGCRIIPNPLNTDLGSDHNDMKLRTLLRAETQMDVSERRTEQRQKRSLNQRDKLIKPILKLNIKDTFGWSVLCRVLFSSQVTEHMAQQNSCSVLDCVCPTGTSKPFYLYITCIPPS